MGIDMAKYPLAEARAQAYQRAKAQARSPEGRARAEVAGRKHRAKVAWAALPLQISGVMIEARRLRLPPDDPKVAIAIARLVAHAGRYDTDT